MLHFCRTLVDALNSGSVCAQTALTPAILIALFINVDATEVAYPLPR